MKATAARIDTATASREGGTAEDAVKGEWIIVVTPEAGEKSRKVQRNGYEANIRSSERAGNASSGADVWTNEALARRTLTPS